MVSTSAMGRRCESPGKPVVLLVLLGLLVLVPAAFCRAESGALVSWGDSSGGWRHLVPGNQYVAVCAGGYHGLALTADGKLATWGDNTRGQCNAPRDGGFTASAAGLYHNLALRSDGSVVAWGDNSRGQCNVPRDRRFRAIAAGSWHNLALGADGSLVAWGWNDQGQCRVPPGNDFTRIAAGYSHSVALRADRSLVAWGGNGEGECDVPPGNDFVAVAAGSLHNVALRSDGTLVAWGRKSEGQCSVPRGNDFVSVAAGNAHGLALKRDGSLVAWGHNGYTQCDVPWDEHFATIAAGGFHSLAIRGRPGMPEEIRAAQAPVPDGSAGARAGRAPDVDLPQEKPRPAQLPAAPEPSTPSPAQVASGNSATTLIEKPRAPALPVTGSDSAANSPGDRNESKAVAALKQEPKVRPVAEPAIILAAPRDTPVERAATPVRPPQPKTPAVSEASVANPIGFSGASRPATAPNQPSRTRPTAEPEKPPASKNPPGKRADAPARARQEQPTVALRTKVAAYGAHLLGRARTLYDTCFTQDRFSFILLWVRQPTELIAVLVFVASVLFILVAFFGR